MMMPFTQSPFCQNPLPKKIFRDNSVQVFACPWVVVVAQLVEQSLPTLEVHSSNPVLNIYCQQYWKDENEEKLAGNVPFFKKGFAHLKRVYYIRSPWADVVNKFQHTIAMLAEIMSCDWLTVVIWIGTSNQCVLFHGSLDLFLTSEPSQSGGYEDRSSM